jgi:hypothetical protein
MKNNKFIGLLFGMTVSLIGTTRADAATFQGVFNSISPTCSLTDVCNGLGTAIFSYGQPTSSSFSNELAFTGVTYPSIPTGNFKVGTLTITNGTIGLTTFPSFTTSAVDRITYLNLNISTTDNIKQGDFLIAYDTTSNLNSIINSPQNADFVYFPLHPEFGAFYILEGTTLLDALASVGILAIDPPNTLFAAGFETIPGQTNGHIAALPHGSIDPNTGYFIPNSTTVPEPLTIVGTLIVATAAFRMKKKLKDIY